MATLNHVLLVGNLTKDVELRYTKGGTAVAGLGLAVNRKWKDQTGAMREEVLFITCNAWGKTAEAANTYLEKGSPVLVEGRLQSRDWETKEGQKRSTIEVVVENLQFLGFKKDGVKDGAKGGASSGATAVPAEVHAGADADVPF